MKRSVLKRKRLGKGFYIALAVCAVAVGTTAYFTVFNTSDKVSPEPQSEKFNVTDWTVPEIEDANKVQSGVVIEPSNEVSENSKEEAPQKSGGAYIMPVTGEIINPFSGGELVKSKTLGEWRTHDGIDIAAKEGSPVKSVFDGTVKEITNDPKWGITVEVEYPAATAYYSGLADTVKVKKGQEISLGDVIGEVGNSSIIESGEESHLHLAMKKDNEWIDPLSVITRN